MPRRILLVDDEEGIRKVLGISLADGGYEVLTAANGEEALRLFREERPCVVLTDIKMPGMDGIELLKRIKTESPETEVIMITGHGDLDLAIRSLQCEAADFVTKPIHDEVLHNALKHAYERQEMRRQLRHYTEGLEKLVEEKTRQLVEAERLAAIGQTVATLAHAIKNIIGGLKGGLYVVEKGMELHNEQYLTQGWTMVRGNVEKIGNLAMDLLNYAREREPDRQRCDPNEVVRQVCGLMASRAEELGVHLEMHLEDGLKEVWLDPEALHCALLNLVTNALDACADLGCGRRTGGLVTVRSGRAAGWAVEYQVTDNGCGMDEETRSRIFRTFFSTKGSRGTGLGLMITQKIIREHQGWIGMDSRPGAGTTFTVRLPRVAGDG